MNDDVVLVELTDIARTELAQRAELVLPAVIVDAGPAAVERFIVPKQLVINVHFRHLMRRRTVHRQ